MPGDGRPEAPRLWRIGSLIATAVGLAVIIGWDLIVANNPWRADTVSEITLWAALRSLTVPGALGYVMGHLTWPAAARRPVWLVLAAGGALLATLVALDVLTWTGAVAWAPLSFARAWPPIVFLPFYVLGRVFWPQVRQ